MIKKEVYKWSFTCEFLKFAILKNNFTTSVFTNPELNSE
jgi:hypothetical protein